jgi:hypothetical protein
MKQAKFILSRWDFDRDLIGMGGTHIRASYIIPRHQKEPIFVLGDVIDGAEHLLRITWVGEPREATFDEAHIDFLSSDSVLIDVDLVVYSESLNTFVTSVRIHGQQLKLWTFGGWSEVHVKDCHKEILEDGNVVSFDDTAYYLNLHYVYKEKDGKWFLTSNFSILPKEVKTSLEVILKEKLSLK